MTVGLFGSTMMQLAAIFRKLVYTARYLASHSDWKPSSRDGVKEAATHTMHNHGRCPTEENPLTILMIFVVAE